MTSTGISGLAKATFEGDEPKARYYVFEDQRSSEVSRYIARASRLKEAAKFFDGIADLDIAEPDVVDAYSLLSGDAEIGPVYSQIGRKEKNIARRDAREFRVEAGILKNRADNAREQTNPFTPPEELDRRRSVVAGLEERQEQLRSLLDKAQTALAHFDKRLQKGGVAKNTAELEWFLGKGAEVQGAFEDIKAYLEIRDRGVSYEDVVQKASEALQGLSSDIEAANFALDPGKAGRCRPVVREEMLRATMS